MADYQEFLTITVLHEKKPVTYKSVARSLGIHVNTAKQALYEFSRSTPDLYTIYCITGVDYKNNQYTIQLVKESELEDKKKAFKTLTGVHVYSVSSFDLKDMSLLIAAYKDMPKIAIEDRVQHGLLKHPHVSRDNKTKSGPSMPPVSKVNTTSITPKSAPLAERKGEKRKEPLQGGPSTKKKAGVTKASQKTPVAVKPSTKKSQQHDDEEIERRMAKTTIKATDIFSDDDDDDFETEPKKEQPKEQPKEPEPVQDIEMEEVEEEKPAKKESLPSLPPGKARRQVVKKRTTRNARGHLVTEEVLEWEIVDAPETEQKPKPTLFKPAENKSNAKKPAAKNTKKPAQAKLSEFFKKV